MSDPYENEPERHAALLVRSQKPFNAETPRVLLGEQINTPNDLFYVRHHLPVPHIDPKEYRLSIEGVWWQKFSLRALAFELRFEAPTCCTCGKTTPSSTSTRRSTTVCLAAQIGGTLPSKSCACTGLL